MAMNELGIFSRLAIATGDALNIELHTMPGRSADWHAFYGQAEALTAHLRLELPGWGMRFYGDQYSRPSWTLAPPTTKATSVERRADYAAQLEALLEENDWPLDSLELVDWIINPVHLANPMRWQGMRPAEHQARHTIIATAREPYAEPFCNGRWPIKYPEIFNELHFELDALEATLARDVIRRNGRTAHNVVMLASPHSYSLAEVEAAGERLLAGGWLIRHPNPPTFISGLGRACYLRRGKSAMISEAQLLRD